MGVEKPNPPPRDGRKPATPPPPPPKQVGRRTVGGLKEFAELLKDETIRVKKKMGIAITLEQKIEVMNAHLEGEEIEAISTHSEPGQQWTKVINPQFDFVNYHYRVKPKLPDKDVVFEAEENSNLTEIKAFDPYRIELAEGIKDGAFKGIWYKYKVRWETHNGEYEARTEFGVSEPVRCGVIVENGTVSVAYEFGQQLDGSRERSR